MYTAYEMSSTQCLRVHTNACTCFLTCFRAQRVFVLLLIIIGSLQLVDALLASGLGVYTIVFTPKNSVKIKSSWTLNLMRSIIAILTFRRCRRRNWMLRLNSMVCIDTAICVCYWRYFPLNCLHLVAAVQPIHVVYDAHTQHQIPAMTTHGESVNMETPIQAVQQPQPAFLQ